MQKVLKSVSLVTENCEVYVFDAKHIFWYDYEIHVDIVHPFQFTNVELFGMAFRSDATYNEDESTVFSDNWKRTDYTWVEFKFDDESVHKVQLTWPEHEPHQHLTEHPGQRFDTTPAGNFVLSSSTNVEGVEENSPYFLGAVDKKA